MSRTIATILNLKDLFSPTMMQTINNTRAFQRELQHTQNEVSKMRNNISDSFGSIKTKVAGVLTGLGIGAIAKQSIELASDLTEVQNVVDVTFGQGATQINTWAKSALSGFGLSELQAKQFTGTLGALMKSSGISSSSLVDMSEKLTGLAGDFASFYNLPIEESFEKIKSGISGETEPLKALGVNMSVANLEAYALSQGISKSWKDMTQGEQTMLRYNYLLNVSKDAQGDFNRTQGTFANQLRIAKTSLEQTGASLGSYLLPPLTSLLQMINSGGIKGLGTTLQNIGNTIASIAKSAVTPLKSLGNSLGNLAQASGLKNLFSGIDTKSLNDIKYIINSLIYGIRDMVDFTSNHIELLKASLVGLGTSLIAIKTISTGLRLFDEFKKGTNLVVGATSMVSRFGRAYMELRTAPSILAGIKGAFSSIFTFNPIILGIVAGVAVFAGIAYLIIKNWKPIKTFFAGLWTGIKNTFSGAINGIKAIVLSIRTVFSSVWAGIKSVALIAWNGLKMIALPIWNGIKFAILTPVLLILDIVTGNWKKLHTDSLKIFNILKLGIMAVWNGIKLFFSTLWNGIKTVAIMAWNGLKTGVVSIVTGIGTWIVNHFNAVVNWFATLPSRLYQFGVSMFTSFKNGASNIIINIGTWIKEKFNAFVQFFKDLPNNAITWAKDMIDGFIQGIKNKINDVKKGAENIAEKIRSILHFSTPDEGPLKPYATWMPDFINGMNQGVIGTTPNIVKGITDMAAGMTAPINSFVSLNNSLGISSVQELNAGIASQASNAVSTAQNLASKILESVKGIFGIHSPSREMFGVGINFMQGFVNSLKSSSVGNVVKKVFGNIASLANGTLGGALSGMVSNFINTGDLKGLGGMLQGVLQGGLSFLGGGSVSGNVSGWLTQALALTGTPMSWLQGLLKLTSYESGDPGTLGSGNASLVNNVSVGGEYATGLLQMLPSTFREFSAGIGDITNPVANAAAAIRYIKSRYGSVYNTPLFTSGGRYNGYAMGTNSANKGVAEVAEDAIEVVTGRQVRSFKGGEHVYNGRETKSLLGGKTIKMTNNFYFSGNVGTEQFFEETGSYIITKVKTALDNM